MTVLASVQTSMQTQNQDTWFGCFDTGDVFVYIIELLIIHLEYFV